MRHFALIPTSHLQKKHVKKVTNPILLMIKLATLLKAEVRKNVSKVKNTESHTLVKNHNLNITQSHLKLVIEHLL